MVAVGTSPEPGRWRSRPYQRPVMDALSDPRVRCVIFVAPSQGGGKSECAFNLVGYHIDADPAPILFVEPTLDMAESISKDRLSPMIAATACLRDKVADPKARDSGNTLRAKSFAGGNLALTGANSASGLSMRPVRVLICDEVDRYPLSAGTEGDPVSLAQARTTAFWNAKEFYPSSPGGRQTSRLLRLWERTDQRLYYVPCGDCGHDQELKWAQVHWEKDEDGRHLPGTARYVCEKCGAVWEDRARWAAIRKGEYRPTKPFTGWAGFHLSGLALLGRKLSDYAERWLAAQGNPEELKAFVNTWLAEWWDDREAEGLDQHEIAKRRETWLEVQAADALPVGVALVTLGVDVQKDRLEYELVGWGAGEESWSLRYGRIYGDIRQNPETLADLDALLLAEYRFANGLPAWVRGCGIDSGYATQTVYGFAQKRLRRVLPDGRSQFVFALKGRSEVGRPVWPTTARLSKRKAAPQSWVIGVDAAKEQVYSRLGIVEAGPGYSHFPADRGIGYFEGLTSEHSVTKYRAGRPYRAYELRQRGRANEPLDARVYSYAVLVGLATVGVTLAGETTHLERVAAELQRIPLVDGRAAFEAAPALPPPPKPARRVIRSNWMQR